MFTFPDRMLKVFKDDETQACFERDGYVVLPFYTEEEMASLRTLYHELHPKNEAGFFPSTFSSDKEYRKVADKEIRRVCERSMNLYLQDFKTVLGAFIVKNPSADSGMCVHQDMSLVDESRFTGINIWVPLIDLTVKNGALFVLPGSHRVFPTYRGSTIPEFFQEVNNEILDYLKPIEIKAGQAVFFDQSIIHFSPPNFSEDVRIVTNTYFTHKDAEYRTYYFDKSKEGQVEVFQQEHSFMTDFEQFGNNIHDRPKVGTSLGFATYDFPMIDAQFLEKRFQKTDSRKHILAAEPTKTAMKSNFFQRIFQRMA